jgi:glycosyltransferase involved in cell wall biosynthesis
VRIAVFTNQYPSRVSTFFAWDMAGLQAAGAELDVYALWPLEADLWAHVPAIGGEPPIPPSAVHHLPIGRALAGVAPWHGHGLGRFALDAARATTAAVRWGGGAVAKTAYVLPQARTWARQAPRYDHVLAYWGNHAATCAWAFARQQPVPTPFSTYLHAGIDLYFQRALLPTKLRDAAAIFPVCEFNERFLAEHAPRTYRAVRDRVHVHHLPIDLERLAYRRDARATDLVLGVGRFDRHKGFHHLVAAMAALPDARLELIGDGDERAALEGQVTRLGLGERVVLRGWCSPDEVLAAMQRATVLAHPSTGLGDAVPTVVKEALAVGLPVVGTDAVGIPELLDQGRAGLLVPPDDATALGHALRSLLADPTRRDHLAAAGRQHAEATFDGGRNGRRLFEILAAAPAPERRARRRVAV